MRPVAEARRAEIQRRCEALYPSGQWQATHVVEADLPMGHE